MKSFLDHFAAILGLATIALIVIAVTHEYGYFAIVGRHFQTVLTTTDYFSNSVVWLPYVIFMVWGIEWHRLREAPVPKRNWKRWQEWIWPIIVALCFVWLIVTATWPPSALLMISLATAILFVWGRVWQTFYQRIDWLEDEVQAVAKHLVRVGPPFLLVVFVWGAVNASSDLQSTENTYFFQLKNHDKSEVKIFLRSFDKGVLLKDYTSSFIEFHRWEEVVLIEKVPAGTTRTLLCKFFDVCPITRPEPPLP